MQVTVSVIGGLNAKDHVSNCVFMSFISGNTSAVAFTEKNNIKTPELCSDAVTLYQQDLTNLFQDSSVTPLLSVLTCCDGYCMC